MSSGSKEDDVPMRQWEEISNASCLDSPTLPGNMTAESLKSNGCSEMLVNCLKKLEKVKDSASCNNANQIKGERYFLDLKDVVGFISNNKKKRNKSRTEQSEEKNGQYNTGYTQARAVLSEKVSVNTWYTMVNHR